MRIIAIILLGCGVQSCTLQEDGVKRCERIIQDRLSAPSFLKRLPNEIGDLNIMHPDLNTGYDQRTISVNYESQEAGMPPVAHRYECVFRLNNTQVGALISSGDRPPRLLNYGRDLNTAD